MRGEVVRSTECGQFVRRQRRGPDGRERETGMGERMEEQVWLMKVGGPK